MSVQNTHQTACCSLVQLRANNNTTLAVVNSRVKAIHKEGQRGIFVIVRWDEEELANTLEKAGFHPAWRFRRNGAAKTDGKLLEMWVKTL